MTDNNRRLGQYFDKSAALVHDACTRFEQYYAQPAYKNMKVYFEERPIVSTFVTVFTLLSLFPIALFAGTAVFIFLTFTLTAVILACLSAFTLTLVLFAVLVLVLLGTLLASFFLTGAILSSYSLLRLALHVQREGPSMGVSEWSRETKHSFLPRKSAADAGPTGSVSAVTEGIPAEEEAEEGEPKAKDCNGDIEPEAKPKEAEEEHSDGDFCP